MPLPMTNYVNVPPPTATTMLGTDAVWLIWNGTGSGTATISGMQSPTAITISNTNVVWYSWNANGAQQTATNLIWQNWVTTSSSSQTQTQFVQTPLTIVQPPPMSAEELESLRQAQEARLKRMEEERKAREEREKAREAARKRAMELLRTHLRPEQLETIDRNGWFVVEGGKSKKQYRIKVNHYAGNIFELKDDKEIASYCVHAPADIPLGDQLLAQTISLRFDEDHLIKLANRRQLVA